MYIFIGTYERAGAPIAYRTKDCGGLPVISYVRI